MIRVVAYLVPIRLRTRWRGCAGIALLLGLTLGPTLFAIAGARRTQSWNDRFLRSVNASTMSVASATGLDPAGDAAISALPQVASSRMWVSMDMAVLVDGSPDFSQQFEPSGTLDGEYFDQDRFTVRRGVLPDPTRPDEVAFNELAAERYGYHVGQVLQLGVYSQAQYSDPSFLAHPTAPAQRRAVTVVGIGLFPDEVLQDDADRTGRLLLTPAFTTGAAPYLTYGLRALVLEHGDADVATVTASVQRLQPPGAEIRFTSTDRLHARQALRPWSIMLALFGLIAGLAGLILGIQAIARLHRRDRAEREMLRAYGAPPRAILLSSLIAPTAGVVAGIGLAVVAAIAASSLMPIGPVRTVGAERGVDVDATVLGFGVIVFVVVLFVATLVIARLGSAERTATLRRSRRTSRLVGAAASAGLPPTMVTGLRMTFERNDGTGVPMRSVIGGAAIAIAALVAGITFAASLATLTSTPRLFGWDWNTMVMAGNGYGNIDAGQTAAILGADEHVADWSGAYFGDDTVDGLRVPLLGMQPASAVTPPIVRGRNIRAADEIVLGAATAADLGKHIGDTVTLAGGGDPHQVNIVGIATFPTIRRIHISHISLGVGAIVVPELVPGYDRDITGVQGTNLGPHVLFVRYRPGTNAHDELVLLRSTTAPLAGFAGIDILPPQRPAEIVNSSSLGGAPVDLSIALALGAAVSLALALGTSVRRRSKELAILTALGFTRRQLAATVAWHSTAATVIGLAIGVPLGVALGRGLWTLFADQLDVVVEPIQPLLGSIGVILAALVVAYAAAVLPARAAGRIDLARLLRAT